MIYKYSHARTALKYGLMSLNINLNDRILIPDYICDVVLHPIKKLGLKYTFYKTLNDFSPDWKYLNEIVNSNCKFILMVHYFGYPQNIEKFLEFCKSKNLYLIEDNAHGYGGKINGKLLGTFGDIGITSPRKNLDCYSGGLLYINNKDINFQKVILKSYKVSFKEKIILNINKNLPKLKNNFLKLLKSRLPYENPYFFKESEIDDFCIDNKSSNIIANYDINKLRDLRINNYYKIKNFLEKNNLEAIYKKINQDCIPWCFPVYAKDNTDAIKWFDWGWKKNITVFSWPTLPSEMLNNKLVYNKWEKLICFSLNNSFENLER